MSDDYEYTDIPDWDADAAEEPPTLAPGIYGKDGEATLSDINVKSGVYSKGPNAGSEWKSMAVRVEVEHPEMGKRSVFSNLFGPFNMALQSKSGSIWPQIAANMGIRPGQPLTDLKGQKVLVEVAHTKGRDGRTQLTIKNLWPAASQA